MSLTVCVHGETALRRYKSSAWVCKHMMDSWWFTSMYHPPPSLAPNIKILRKTILIKNLSSFPVFVFLGEDSLLPREDPSFQTYPPQTPHLMASCSINRKHLTHQAVPLGAEDCSYLSSFLLAWSIHIFSEVENPLWFLPWWWVFILMIQPFWFSTRVLTLAVMSHFKMQPKNLTPGS